MCFKSVEIYYTKHDDMECLKNYLRSIRQDGTYYYSDVDNEWYKKSSW